MTRPRRRSPAAAAALLLPGCTSFADTVPRRTAPPSDRRAVGPGPATPVGAAACPPSGPSPIPTVRGSRSTSASPTTWSPSPAPRPSSSPPTCDVDELVFRLVPNAPGLGAGGQPARSSTTSAGTTSPGPVRGRRRRATRAGCTWSTLDGELGGGGDRPRSSWTSRSPSGSGAFDRVGADDGVTWWASGAPLLAWEPGVGWARDPFVGILGETATSPAADVELTRVRAGGPHRADDRRPGRAARRPADGRRTWTSTEPVARDVSVAAGRFTTERADDARRHPASPWACCPTPSCAPDRARRVDRSTRSPTWRRSSAPFPYDTLTHRAAARLRRRASSTRA